MMCTLPSAALRPTVTFACEKFHKRVNSPREMADDRVPAPEREQGPAGGSPSGPSHAKFAGSGIQFAISILLFLYIGKWLDAKLGTAPWLLMLGVFVGAVAGFYSFYRSIMAGQRGDGDK
jgi:ATP synthase protein I